MKILLIPTKPAQLNMAAIIYGAAPAHDKPDLFVPSQALDRMNLTENLELWALPDPVSVLDTSVGQDAMSEGIAALGDKICTLCEEGGYEAIMTFGDMDPVLAGAVAQRRADLRKIICVDGGVRSDAEPKAGWVLQRQMVEPVADIVFTRQEEGVAALKAENARGKVVFTGDIGDDIAAKMLELCDEDSHILEENRLCYGEYVFASISQVENYDDPDHLRNILSALQEIATYHSVALLVDHKTDAALKALSPEWEKSLMDTARAAVVIMRGGLPALDVAALVKNAEFVFSDMVLAQTMSRFAGIPCIVPRQEAAWLADSHAHLLPPNGFPNAYIVALNGMIRKACSPEAANTRVAHQPPDVGGQVMRALGMARRKLTHEGPSLLPGLQ